MVFLVTATLAVAEVPQMINYQGRLTDSATGEPIADGTHFITFRIYGGATGDDPLWSSGNQEVEV